MIQPTSMVKAMASASRASVATSIYGSLDELSKAQ